MFDDDLFDYAVTNVNFVDFGEGLSLMIFSTFEVNTNDVRFYVDEKKPLLSIHYPSDNIMVIPIESEETYEELKLEKKLRIYEINMISGEIQTFYFASI